MGNLVQGISFLDELTTSLYQNIHHWLDKLQIIYEKKSVYNKEKFDVVINDGDMGSNILQKIEHSKFVCNKSIQTKLYNHDHIFIHP